MPLPSHFSTHRAPAAPNATHAPSSRWPTCYSAVQCDLYPHLLMEQALETVAQETPEQRSARQWQAQRQRPLRWVMAASVLVSGVGVWWLL